MTRWSRLHTRTSNKSCRSSFAFRPTANTRKCLARSDLQCALDWSWMVNTLCLISHPWSLLHYFMVNSSSNNGLFQQSERIIQLSVAEIGQDHKLNILHTHPCTHNERTMTKNALHCSVENHRMWRSNRLINATIGSADTTELLCLVPTCPIGCSICEVKRHSLGRGCLLFSN